MRRLMLIPAVATAALGCMATGTSAMSGGATTALRRPVASRCEQAGLQGCADMVEGVLLYAAQNPIAGQAALSRGASHNADNPDQLEAFAEALLTLQSVPGAGQYVEPILPAVEVLKNAAEDARMTPASGQETVARDEATGGPTTAKEPASTPSRPYVPDKQYEGIAALNAMYSGFVEPAGDPDALPCRLGNIAARCIASVPGRRLVEQIYVSSACGHDTFVQGGPVGSPKWVVHVPAGEGLKLVQARLPVGHGDFLVFGAIGPDGKPPTADPRCGIGWVAVGPPRGAVIGNPYR